MKFSCLLLAVLTGCVSTAQTPPLVRSSAAGEARAWTEADLSRLAEELARQGPRVRAALGSQRAPPRVFLSRVPILEPISAYTAQNLIVIGPGTGRQEELVLVHELAHWYMRPAFDELPETVEEGLADVLAGQMLPQWDVGVRIAHMQGLRGVNALPTPEIAFGPDDQPTWRGRSHAETGALLGMGYGVARSIGLQGLRELCEAARASGLERIPPALLLERARIDPRRLESWASAMEVALDAAGNLLVEAPGSLPPGKCLKVTFTRADGSVIATQVIRVYGSCQVPPGSAQQSLEIIDCPPEPAPGAQKP